MYDRIDRIERSRGPAAADRVAAPYRIEGRDEPADERHERRREDRREPDPPEEDDGRPHVDVLV
jgi:hypothetical protein